MTCHYHRPPNIYDKFCDTCEQPMIGIMKVSGKQVRTTCEGCGGKALNCTESDE